MTTTTTEAATQASPPEPITLHWIMTIQTSDGRQGTNDGQISAVPGVHTHAETYTVVRAHMKDWIGTDNFTVVFFSLTPNQF